MKDEETITISKHKYFVLCIALHTAVCAFRGERDERAFYKQLFDGAEEMARSIPSDHVDELLRTHPIETHFWAIKLQPLFGDRRGFKPLVQKSKRRRK